MRIYKIDMIRSIITNRENRDVMASISEAKNSELMDKLKRNLRKEFCIANQSLFEKHGCNIFNT